MTKIVSRAHVLFLLAFAGVPLKRNTNYLFYSNIARTSAAQFNSPLDRYITSSVYYSFVFICIHLYIPQDSMPS